MNAFLSELEHWNQLELHWQQAKECAVNAQKALDYKMYVHLKSKGVNPAPTIEEQAAINQLWEAEGESREDMDIFISARLEK